MFLWQKLSSYFLFSQPTAAAADTSFIQEKLWDYWMAAVVTPTTKVKSNRQRTNGLWPIFCGSQRPRPFFCCCCLFATTSRRRRLFDVSLAHLENPEHRTVLDCRWNRRLLDESTYFSARSFLLLPGSTKNRERDRERDKNWYWTALTTACSRTSADGREWEYISAST